MRERIMREIIEAVRRVHGHDRWPSDVEQKVDQIADLLAALLDEV
jgi:hypothetical protein